MTTRALALAVALLWGSLESYAVSPPIDPFYFIVPDAEWRYWDKTEYPGDAWRTLAFDDSSWSQGAAPLGFGDLNGIVPATPIANNRQTTSYFRRTFVVANPARFNQLALSLLRDDGAVVWLNESELWRHNLPATGPILPTTEASAVTGGTDESTWWTTNVASTALRAGTNVLAVEVHQYLPLTSSDLGLNFALEGLNANARPALTVTADYTLAEAPVSFQLTAAVSDDGLPLPANPANPDPQDPNKLRWHWSAISVPTASAGVVWSGSATNGAAFTYPDSANPPGTVFACNPTATFDAPGLYLLEFRADDGEKQVTQQVNVLVRATGDYRQIGYLYLSPVPGAQHVAAQTRFVLVRFANAPPTQVTNLASFIRVTGARSGTHPGQTRIASDGRTVIFQMSNDFSNDEIVTVTLNPRLAPEATATVDPYLYQFAVAGFLGGAAPGTITARGQNPPNETKEKAFDNLTQSKWVDGVVPDGTANFTWIQYLYPNDDTHVVNAYAITSANDQPERDPQGWRFYGVSPSGARTLLDVQTNQTFNGRFQERTFAFTNLIAYRGYRLEITRVRDPGTANAVQLAELALLEPAGSILREYWTGIPGNEIADLRASPDFPNSPDGRDALPSLETPVDWAEEYGTRLRGWLTAPNTGDFLFWIASDDSSELWLSTDDTPANATRIANVTGWTTSREWSKYSSQKSAPVRLTAGQKYYVEALQKEGIGGDNLAVGWAKPGQGTSAPSEVIPGSVLSPWPAGTSAAPAGRGGIQLAGGPTSQPSSSPVRPNGVSVPSDFPRPVITVNRNPAPGYLFLENAGQGGTTYTMILDNDGSPVWYRRGGGREFKVQKNGLITWAAFTGVDKNFKYVRDYYASNGHATDDHELKVLEDGGYLLIGFHDQSGIDLTRYLSGASRSATVHATALQEFTATGELIFQFRAWDHFNIADVEPVVEDPRAGNVRFSHMNAIDVDTDGHLLISSRHISEVTKIDRNTGQILWRLSGAHSDFRFVNDSLNGFRNQHDISALGNNRYMVFDNGNGHNPSVSRAVEYELDLTNRTATLVWQFRNAPDRYTHYMGNAQRLPNGNTLINFVLAGYPKVTEVDRGGVKQFEMNLSPGSDLYRAFRFPWDGVVAAPYLILEAYPDNVTLIFNKFGDRAVDHYRIYGGTAASPTKLLATSRTPLLRLHDVVNGTRNYFRVTAVSTNGVESPYSNEESTVVNIVQPGQNMVLNGDFAANTNSWTWSVSGTGAATWSIADGAARVDVTAPGTQLADIQLRQANLKLLQGRQYVLEFDAWAAQPRPLEARLGQNRSPWTTFRLATVALTPLRQHFRFPFSMTAANDLDVRLAFNLGAATPDAFLDNVSVWLVAPGDLNLDRRVDYADVAILTGQWLQTGIGRSADFNGDQKVDFKDLAILGENWSAASSR